ncbi:uncharacterized protein FOMMEDRAFT_141732 [Fomitiporia mediterranea MF3/22]|uniref:uncharacterized protein n=1 Tax=Fomitiporia mediterranea (strain MF3/22) TaxID=694068 RepID=UPI0004409ACF|nr:uncharacterized protein FOMMEDRAFT_141732 [Fomitiporia mediterranea MF3/22]EJD00983.1 hypothetical protein FOMMEDRAFT_141732 [Fomitiporia mediterranea MF3/22]
MTSHHKKHWTSVVYPRLGHRFHFRSCRLKAEAEAHPLPRVPTRQFLTRHRKPSRILNSREEAPENCRGAR